MSPSMGFVFPSWSSQGNPALTVAAVRFTRCKKNRENHFLFRLLAWLLTIGRKFRHGSVPGTLAFALLPRSFPPSSSSALLFFPFFLLTCRFPFLPNAWTKSSTTDLYYLIRFFSAGIASGESYYICLLYTVTLQQLVEEFAKLATCSWSQCYTWNGIDLCSLLWLFVTRSTSQSSAVCKGRNLL